jgi:hypothetical protein
MAIRGGNATREAYLEIRAPMFVPCKLARKMARNKNERKR